MHASKIISTSRPRKFLRALIESVAVVPYQLTGFSGKGLAGQCYEEILRVGDYCDQNDSWKSDSGLWVDE